MPESGIGYQLIKARPEGSLKEKSYVVFNSEIVIENNEKLNTYSYTLIGNGYHLLNEVLNLIELEDMELEKCPENNTKDWYKTNIEAVNHKIKPHDIYIRPSVYEKDNRVDLNNKVLLPGSYVTTLENYTDCHIMSEDPFEKYSLPVRQEFLKIHYIKQTGEKNITNAIFESAFGKRGGGIKLNFSDYGKLLIKENEPAKKTGADNGII